MRKPSARTHRFVVVLSRDERKALALIARTRGTSGSAVLREFIRTEARHFNLQPAGHPGVAKVSRR